LTEFRLKNKNQDYKQLTKPAVELVFGKINTTSWETKISDTPDQYEEKWVVGTNSDILFNILGLGVGMLLSKTMRKTNI